MGQSLSYLPCVPAYNAPEDDVKEQQDEGVGEDSPPAQEIIGGGAGGSKSLKLQKSIFSRSSLHF